VQRRQLGKYCPHALLWFADHTLEAPFEKARRPFSVAEMRRAGDLFALASRSPIDVGPLSSDRPDGAAVDAARRVTRGPGMS
jgi:hypothetical protein